MSVIPTKSIFLSYARKDGRDLALRLQSDLHRAGYDSWLDTSEIEGGASWSNDIEQAIERCNLTLALLSHASLVSEICRAEQLRSLRKGKRVIPLLVQSDAERPLHLEHLNYRDFTDASRYTEQFAVLLNDIESDERHIWPEHYRPGFNNAPRLPENFVPRPEDLIRLRRAVLGDETDRKVALTALRGMGGIGKSVLAAALCHDELSQDAFPDGVIWLTIGRQPGSLIEQMKTLGIALGDAGGHYSSEIAAIANTWSLVLWIMEQRRI